MQVAGVSSSSGSMYQQALTHLHQQRFELAFVAAKQALDAAAGHSVESSSNSTRPRPDSVVTATGKQIVWLRTLQESYSLPNHVSAVLNVCETV